jgi:hypothetical protein
MGNVALRTGQQITWDNSSSKFNNREANELIMPAYHNGWKLPKV